MAMTGSSVTTIDRPRALCLAAASPAASPASSAASRRLNSVLRQIARLLVPLNYARGERFDHDPALKFGPVPRLEAAASLASAPADLKPFIKVGLVREANKVRATIRAARRELKASMDARVLQ